MYVTNNQTPPLKNSAKLILFCFSLFFFGSWVIFFLETGSSFSEEDQEEEEEEKKRKAPANKLVFVLCFWFTFQQQIKNKIVGFVIS